jgi:hypothetical protein
MATPRDASSGPNATACLCVVPAVSFDSSAPGPVPGLVGSVSAIVPLV